MIKMVFAALGLALAAPAVAEDFSVSFKADDLLTSGGRAQVVERVNRAAERACIGNGGLAEVSRRHVCVKELGGEMVAQINNPQLSAQWRGKPISDSAIASR